MSREDLERLDDQGIAAWDTHDPDLWESIFADKFQLIDRALPGPITDREGVRAYAQAWFTAFPDMKVTQVRRLVDGDQVGAEIQFTGTNSGPMMMGGKEIPPTGKTVVGHGVYFARADGGKVVEFSAAPDVMGVMAQLGLMPPM
jgi:predicted ester cyclase